MSDLISPLIEIFKLIKESNWSKQDIFIIVLRVLFTIITFLLVYVLFSLTGLVPVIYLPSVRLQEQVLLFSLLVLLFSLLLLVGAAVVSRYRGIRLAWVWDHKYFWGVVVITSILILMAGLVAQPSTSDRFIIIKPIEEDNSFHRTFLEFFSTIIEQNSIPARVLTVGCLPVLGFPCHSESREQLLSDPRVALVIEGKLVDEEMVEVTYFASGSHIEIFPPTLLGRQEPSSGEQQSLLLLLSRKDYKSLSPIYALIALSRIESDRASRTTLLMAAHERLAKLRGIDWETIWGIYETIVLQLLDIEESTHANYITEYLTGTSLDGEARLAHLIARVTEQTDPLSAIEQYQQVLRLDKTHSNSLRALARLSYDWFRYTDAICYSKEAQRYQEASPNPNLDLIQQDRSRIAAANRKLNRSEEATRTQQEVIENIPPTSDVAKYRLQKSRVHRQQEEYDRAEEELQLAITQTTNRGGAIRAEAHLELGIAKINKGENEEALDTLSTLENEYKHDTNLNHQALAWKGHAYNSNGDPVSALDHYQQALEKAPNREARIRYSIESGRLENYLGNPREALKLYQQADQLIRQRERSPHGWDLSRRAKLAYFMALPQTAIGQDDKANFLLNESIELFTQLIDRAESAAKKDFKGCEFVNELYHQEAPLYQELSVYAQESRVPSNYYYDRRVGYEAVGNREAVLQDAIRQIERLQVVSNAIEAHTLGQAYLAAGEKDLSKIIDTFEEAIVQDNPKAKDDVADAADYQGIGQAYFNADQYSNAIEPLKRAHELQPNPLIKGEILHLLGKTYVKLGQYDTATTTFQEAIEIDNPDNPQDPADALDYHLLGRLYQEQQRWAEAEEAFKQAIALDNPDNRQDPADAVDYHLLGRVYQEQQRWAEAEDAFKKAIALDNSDNPQDPADAVDYYQLGLLYREQKRWEEAEEAFKKAIALDNPDNPQDPADASDYHELGKLYKEQKRWAEAEEAFKQAIALDNPDNLQDPADAGDNHQLGLLYREQKRWAEAEEAFNKAIALDNPGNPQDPADAGDYHQLGLLYREQKRWAEAEEPFKQAIALDNPNNLQDPADAADYYYLAHVYLGLGDQPNALKSLDRCIELDELNEQQFWKRLAVPMKAEMQ